ncbi:hypothetical protein BRC77_12130 [Halobacteriales archaeon QH_8_64_26]|nr:MAG: hypothetical protein BRC77_12130 [Halobacteriales archaeon QH_8_64_26]
MPGEHGGAARDDHGREAGLSVRTEQCSTQRVGRHQGDDPKDSGQDACERERGDSGIQQRGEQVEAKRRVREGDPAGRVAGNACGQRVAVLGDGLCHREKESPAERRERMGEYVGSVDDDADGERGNEREERT